VTGRGQEIQNSEGQPNHSAEGQLQHSAGERPGRSDNRIQLHGTKKLTYLALLTAVALVLSYVESLIPFFGGIPGMKLGLPNAAIVLVLYLFGWKEALLVNLVRVAAVGLLFGNLFSIAFSACGALLSMACMAAVKRSRLFSIEGVSVIGGLTHNLGQILVAMVIVDNVRIAYYFLPLAISGVITGVLIGIIAGRLRTILGRPAQL